MRAVPRVTDAVNAQGKGKGTDWYHNSVQNKAKAKLAQARTQPVAKKQAEFVLRPMSDKEKKNLVRINTIGGAVAGAGVGAALGAAGGKLPAVAGAGVGGLVGGSVYRAQGKRIARNPNIRVGEWQVSKAGISPARLKEITTQARKIGDASVRLSQLKKQPKAVQEARNSQLDRISAQYRQARRGLRAPTKPQEYAETPGQKVLREAYRAPHPQGSPARRKERLAEYTRETEKNRVLADAFMNSRQLVVRKALGGSTPAIARRISSLGAGVRPPTAPMPAKTATGAQGSKSLRPLNQQGLRQPAVGQSNKSKRQSFPRL